MLETRALTLLQIFLAEADKAGGGPLYEALVVKAREMHLAGATVLRGPMGFGHAAAGTPRRSSACTTCQ